MDPTVAALLAAGIPALVAAVTFVIGEVLRERSRRDERIASAVERFAEALERIVIVEDAPWYLRTRSYATAYSRPTATAAALVAAVRPRDREVALWFLRRTDDFSILGRADRVRLSGYLLASLRLWPVERDRVAERAATDARPYVLATPERRAAPEPQAGR